MFESYVTLLPFYIVDSTSWYCSRPRIIQICSQREFAQTNTGWGYYRFTEPRNRYFNTFVSIKFNRIFFVSIFTSDFFAIRYSMDFVHSCIFLSCLCVMMYVMFAVPHCPIILFLNTFTISKNGGQKW